MTQPLYDNLLIVRELEAIKKNYDTVMQLVPGLPFSQKLLVRMIEFYSNSRYLNGQKDELDRDKPFYNIVNGMCDVENAAKDLDTSDITVQSDDGNHYTESFLLTKELFEWMKYTNFAKTLNDMRDMHTRYGSVLAKKYIEKDRNGERQIRVGLPEWKNTVTDQMNILGSPIVECHYMWPYELRAKKDWHNVEDVIKKYGGKDYSKKIPVYEVRGVFSQAVMKNLQGLEFTEADKTSYSYQLIYLAGQYTDAMATAGTDLFYFSTKMIPVYWEDKTEETYKYLARKKKSGRDFGVGVVEEGEEAQIWSNDAVLKQFRAMEFTSKVIGQTASKKLKGRNLLSEVDDGQILEHEDNKPVTALTLLPAGGLSQYTTLLTQWFMQYERATSSYGAQRGESPTSRTSFKLQEAVINQSASVLGDLQEDLGIFVTEILEEWVLPFLATKLNKKHILSHEFSMEELREIDKNFSTHHANKRATDQMLSGRPVTVSEYQAFYNEADQSIKRTKAVRFLDVPDEYYKEVLKNVSVYVNNERRNKAAVLESLNNIMMVYAKNPQVANDPVLTQIFMRIVELSGAGISPMAMISAFQEQAKMQAQKSEQEAQQQAAAVAAQTPEGPAQPPAQPAMM